MGFNFFKFNNSIGNNWLLFCYAVVDFSIEAYSEN